PRQPEYSAGRSREGLQRRGWLPLQEKHRAEPAGGERLLGIDLPRSLDGRSPFIEAARADQEASEAGPAAAVERIECGGLACEGDRLFEPPERAQDVEHVVAHHVG